MSRFPLVLGAVVSSCHPDRQSPLFGIFPLWRFLSSDRTLAFDIGPNEAWFQSAREYRLLTNEALRTLRSEFPKEELADRLLRAVPEFCGRQLLSSDSPHRWMEGRHPQKPWVWFFQDVFHILDDPPPAGAQSGEGEKPDDPFAELRAFARAKLKGQERAVIEALCDAGGELPIADLAILDGIGWDDPLNGFRNAQQRLKRKLKRLKWTLSRQAGAAKLNPMKS